MTCNVQMLSFFFSPVPEPCYSSTRASCVVQKIYPPQIYVTNFPQNVPVKTFLKICQYFSRRCGQKFATYFFVATLYTFMLKFCRCRQSGALINTSWGRLTRQSLLWKDTVIPGQLCDCRDNCHLGCMDADWS